MATATPTLALPYPVGADNANGPGAFQALAERTEALLAYEETGRVSVDRNPDGSVVLDLVDDSVGATKLGPVALKALAALTPAAGRIPRFTGASSADLVALSTFVADFLDAADAAAAREALGISGLGFQLADTLPGGALDGQQVFFQNAAMADEGVLWHLRYNDDSSSPYPWEVAGASDLLQTLTGSVSVTGSTYLNLGGPSITVPLAGDYDLSYGAVTESDDVMISPQVGSTPASDADAAKSISGLSALRRKTGLAADSAIILRYKLHEIGSSEAPDTVWNRWLRVRPVRVG